MEPRKIWEPKNEVFEGDVCGDFMKLTWEEQLGAIFSISYMTWGRGNTFQILQEGENIV